MTRRALALCLLTAVASPASAELTVASESYGFALVKLETLPDAPTDTGETALCNHLFLPTPETPGGRDAQAKGWHVTAELPFGGFTAVSFIASALPATSGTCELIDGNVGFYSRDQLVALLYGTLPDEAMIGRIRPFGDTGLRVLSGDVLPYTMADLTVDGSSLTVTDPAAEEPVCTGTATVPQIEGLPIDEARVVLQRSGWTPIPGDPAKHAFSQATEIAAAGVPEVEDCSGTGFAFCAYRYSSPTGDLSVITAGEGGESGGLPLVARYSVDCKPG
jgi:hypothetical protein